MLKCCEMECYDIYIYLFICFVLTVTLEIEIESGVRVVLIVDGGVWILVHLPIIVTVVSSQKHVRKFTT